MSRQMRRGIGVAVVAALIVIAGWYDATVLRAAVQQQGVSFDIGPSSRAQSLGSALPSGRRRRDPTPNLRGECQNAMATSAHARDECWAGYPVPDETGTPARNGLVRS
jgi:hypothetical protein